MTKFFLDGQGKFVIEDYNRAYPFSNFLPAISGLWGIPLWAFFVNRGQGLVSMGVKDKDHAILEFLPANRAYQAAPTLGFRTFVKIDGHRVYEPFRSSDGLSRKEKMIITSHDVSFEEANRSLGLDFKANYFTLPNMPFGALVRTLTIKNNSRRKVSLEILDGMPKVIPFGSRDIFLKFLSRTLEAWMTSDVKKIHGRNTALFRLFVDPEDAASTQHIEGVNFSFAFHERGNKVISSGMIVDPAVIFAEDTSFESPVNFIKKGFSVSRTRVTCGKTPCSFSFSRISLRPGQETDLYTLTGAMLHASLLAKNLKPVTPQFLRAKKEENSRLVEGLKQNAFCVSEPCAFDEYIQCSYLDNILRGGFPYMSPKGNSYYVYSRKHGDLERDYNKFNFLPSYFSQGEANYRDINQNRRMDNFFTPSIADKNIVSFLNLLRMDGYNPLLVQGEKYYFDSDAQARTVLKKTGLPPDKEIVALMRKGFYLGEFFGLLERKNIVLRRREKTAHLLMDEALCEQQAEHGEGFWSDHWFYNMDLIESYLYFYPERLEKLFLHTELAFWDDEYRVVPRCRRYVSQGGKVLQLNAVESVPEKGAVIAARGKFRNFLRTGSGKGPIYKTTLLEKMTVLLLNKVTTLDFGGIGIEMEAGKPGWCDSLNGLPALFGSSLCETLELKRLAVMLRDVTDAFPSGVKISLSEEVYGFLLRVEALLAAFAKKRGKSGDMWWWDRSNSLKEDFRDSVFSGISGKKRDISPDKLGKFFNKVIRKLDSGIRRARDKKSGVCITYYRHEIEKFTVGKSGAVNILRARGIPLPLFLEGPVHALKVEKDRSLHGKVKKSGLFDKKLKMYRINASLSETPLEIGRSRAFPPGWLENESIWLHMEYKYLLELLRNGMYDEFYRSFRECGICFQDPQKYGRSILENSSFLVSSAYPDRSLWGKGFVARLTGATSEVLSIWGLMCLGHAPFFLDDGGAPCLRFAPLLKADFFTRRPRSMEIDGRTMKFPANAFAFKIFSRTVIVYHNPLRKDTYSGKVRTKKIEIVAGGSKTVVEGPVLPPSRVRELRQGKIDEIHVYFV